MMKESGNTTVNNGRMYSMDLLRCLAMMLVVVLHFLGKGNFLTPVTSSEPMGVTEVFAWLLESFALVAVNLYMLLSGYFLGEASIKPRRLITLWLQVWAFSVVVGFGGLFLGVVPKSSVDTYYKLRLLLPISMEQYWFMKAYFFLYRSFFIPCF